MTEVIWKYPLELLDAQVIDMPHGAEILCVQEQSGSPCIWARVDPNAEKKPVRINLYGTGQKTDEIRGKYIGTVQLTHLTTATLVFGVPLVLHFYVERIK